MIMINVQCFVTLAISIYDVRYCRLSRYTTI